MWKGLDMFKGATVPLRGRHDSEHRGGRARCAINISPVFERLD